MARNSFSTTAYLENANAVATAAPITMVAWVFPTDVTTESFLVSIHRAATTREIFGLRFLSSNLEAVAISSGGSTVSQISAGSTSVWKHCAAVFASSTSRTVYLNGTAGTTDTTSKTPTSIDHTSIGITQLGDTGAHYGPVIGSICEVGIWSVALDAAEINALSKGFCPMLIRPTSLLGYWPVLGNLSPEPDLWRSNLAMTLTGSPAKADHTRMYYPIGDV